LAPNEAFWIGLQPDASVTPIRVTLTAVAQHTRTAPVQLHVDASGGRIAGYVDANGQLRSFAREVDGRRDLAGCSSLACTIEGSENQDPAMVCSLVIRLVDPSGFTNESGQPAPPPIDPDAGYRGHLLP
jgi:hypothetical protein